MFVSKIATLTFLTRNEKLDLIFCRTAIVVAAAAVAVYIRGTSALPQPMNCLLFPPYCKNMQITYLNVRYCRNMQITY